MARLHVGTTTTLEAVPAASCSNGDIAYIWLNGYTRKMIYNSTATYATDTSNHPYKQRPSDYGAAGVWVEDIGADQPEVWSMDQIKTGELIIADDGSIHTDSKTSYADTDAGFWFGYDSTAHKINFGNANSYIKWSGAAMAIKMASGETFDLYGSMNIYDGGDITLNPSDTDPALIKWGAIHNLGAASTTARGLCIWPTTEKQDYLAIGYDPVGAAVKSYYSISLNASFFIDLSALNDSNNYARTYCKSVVGGAPEHNINFILEQGGTSKSIQFDFAWNALKPAPTDTIGLGNTFYRWAGIYGMTADLDQSASDGAKPVITVDQADISEEFIKFIGSAANGVLTQSIVDEGDQGSATLAGWLKISVEDVGDQVTDGAYHIPFYTLAA